MSFTTYIRRPYNLVLVNNQIVSNVLQVRTAEGFDLDTPTAEIEVRGPVSYAKWSLVVVIMGATQGSASQCFTGYLLECDTELYPNATKMLCGGYLSKMTTTCNTVGGLDLSNSGAGATDQAIIGTLLDQCGLTTAVVNRSIGGTGSLIGTVATTQCRWNELETGLACVQRFDDFCLGYKTFEGAGTIFRQKITANPSSSAVYTFTEGVDIYRATLRDSVREAKNRVQVTGYNNGTTTVTYTVSQYSPFVPNPSGYITESKSNDLIERTNTADPGNGIAAEDVSIWWLGEVNRELYETTLITPLDYPIRSGMTIAVVSPTRLGQANQLYWVKHVERTIDRKNKFQQTLTVISGLSATAPIQLPPTADFAFTLLEQESVLIAGVQTTIYTVACTAVVGPSSGTISTYAWSTSGSPAGSPATGALSTFVTSFQSLSGATITLQITDSNGLTGSITKAVPSTTAATWVQRKLYGAGTSVIDDYDGNGTWWVSTQSNATVVANGPLWGAGTAVLTSANDLATAPTSTSPFGANTTAAWVETDASQSNLLVGSVGGQLAYSTNGGSSWTVKTGPDGNAILRCVLSRSVPGQWFALTAAGLYRTDNYGSGWVTLLAAAGGETFRDFNLSFGPYLVTMSGGRLAVDQGGNTMSFPALTPAVSDVIAVTADIASAQFFCYDSQGRTFYTSASGGTSMTQMTSLAGTATPEPRGLWRDGVIRGLLYYAAGADGIYKRLGSFESSPTEYQIRKPGVGNSPVGAVYTQVGVDGLLSVGKVTPVTIVSQSTADNANVKGLNLWNGSSNNSPPSGFQNPGYDATAWGPCIIAGSGTPAPAAGSYPITPGTTLGATNQQILTLQTFTLSSGVIDSATLSYSCDNYALAIYVNGTFVAGSPSTQMTVPITIPINPGLLNPGGSNVIAVWGQNNGVGATTNQVFNSYALSVS